MWDTGCDTKKGIREVDKQGKLKGLSALGVVRWNKLLGMFLTGLNWVRTGEVRDDDFKDTVSYIYTY